jgi:hypothetical protein
MFVAALNVAAVGMLWFLAQRYINASVAFVAGLAYAVNPWAIGFSRSVWAQDYIALFFLLALLLGLQGFIEEKRWAQLISLPVFLLAVQLHFAAWLLLPLYGWLVWVGRKQVSRRSLFFSAILSLLVLLPFLMGILLRLMDNLTLIRVQPVERTFTLRELIKPYGQMIWLMTGLGTEQYSAREQAAEIVAAVPVPMVLWLLLGAVTVLGSFATWLRLPRSLAVFLLFWAFFPLLFFTPPLTGVFPFYFIASIPALCLLAGIGVIWIWDKLNERILPRFAVAGVFGVIFFTQGLWSIGVTNYLDSTYTSGQFGSGTPIHYLYGVKDELSKYNDVIVIGSSDWLHITHDGSRVWASLLRHISTCVRDVLIEDNFVVFPNGPFAVAVAPRISPPPLMSQLYQTDNPTVFSLRPGEGDYRIYHFDTAPAWPGPVLTEFDPIRFDNEVTLTGYHLEQDRVYLQWTLPEATRANYQYSVTILDESGVQISEQTNAFWPGLNWCAGDRLMTWLDVEVPAAAEAIGVSLFQPGRNQDVVSNVIDVTGTVVGASVNISLDPEAS